MRTTVAPLPKSAAGASHRYHLPIVVRRVDPELPDYGFSFEGHMVKIGLPIGTCVEQSNVFRLHKYDDHAPVCIRIMDRMRWKQEMDGFQAQILGAAASNHILPVVAYGAYAFDHSGTETETKGTIRPATDFHDHVGCDRGLYSILPLCEGGDMFSMINDVGSLQRVTASDIVDTTRLLLCSLKGLKSEGIIHGDIKPENICYQERCSATGTPRVTSLKLIDFGYAKIDKEQKGIVHTGGTYPYMSPEVFDNQRGMACILCDNSIDMFSAGATLFILCNEWLREHHGENQYPGRLEYEKYLESMCSSPPDDRNDVYQTVTRMLAARYASEFAEDHEGCTIVDLLIYIVPTMTKYNAWDRTTAVDALLLLHDLTPCGKPDSVM